MELDEDIEKISDEEIEKMFEDELEPEPEQEEPEPEVVEVVEVKSRKRHKKNYINNADFTAAMAEWVAAYKLDKTAPMSPYIGECFMKLVNGCAKKPNFSGYTYIEDMKSEALMTCMKYAKNFDIKKSQNAFAYFTRFIMNAFVGVLKAEKKIADLKFNYIKELCETSDKYDYKQLLGNEEAQES